MTPLVGRLLAALRAQGIGFSHFKSNNTLDRALEGEGDLDLLVAWDDRPRFMTVLLDLDFRHARDRDSDANSLIAHHYAFDRDAGRLIHLHVYFRIITAGTICKNHHLQFERMLLEQSNPLRTDIPTPIPEADLLCMVVRKGLELISPVEHLLFTKDIKAVRAELAWLRAAIDETRMDEVIARWAPQLSPALFREAYDILMTGSAWQRFRLGWRLLPLFPVTLAPLPVVEFNRAITLAGIILRPRLGLKGRGRFLASGGVVVAFIGGEGSGKSTLTAATTKAFSPPFDLLRVHLGKPPRNPVSAAILAANRLAGRLRRRRSRSGPPPAADAPRPYATHPVVAVLDAVDRFLAVRRCIRRAGQGTLVITDRYPNREPGAVDGPSIRPTGRWTALLSRIERAFYDRIPDPDLVLVLSAPIEAALARNATRPEPAPEEFVRERHARIAQARFGHAPTIRIDTSRPLDETIATVRDVVWNYWGGSRG